MKDLRKPTTHQCSCYVAGVWIILCVVLPTYKFQMIVNKPANDDFQCPGQEIVLTCITRGSRLITWRSAEYIGANRLQFSDSRSEGDTQRMSETVATLTRNELEEQLLESQLRIVVGSDISFPSVSCARDNGTADTVTLRVLVDAPPMGDIHIISDQRMLNSAGDCIVHYSWSLPSNVTMDTLSHFMVFFNETQLQNESVNTTFNIYMNSHHVCTCDTHSVSIATVDRCNREGSRVVHLVKNPEPLTDKICGAGFSFSPSRNTDCSSEDLNVPAIVLGVLHAPSWIVIGVLVSALIWIGYLYHEVKKEKGKINPNNPNEMVTDNTDDKPEGETIFNDK